MPVTRKRPVSRRPTTTRTAAEASSTPATLGLATTSELFAHGARARVERVAEARGILPTAGGAIGRSAATAVDDRRELLHEVPRVNARGEVFAHRHREPRPPGVRGAEDRDAGPQSVADTIGETAQDLLVVVADILHDELRAVEQLRGRDEAVRGLIDAALLQGRELLLQALARLLHLRHRLGQPGRGNLERGRGAVDAVAHV